jgi:repressor of nif and glnA expression
MQLQGYDLSDRTIRFHLLELEKEGLVTEGKRGRDGGRTLTYQGSEEVRNSLVQERVGFIATRVEAMSCQVTFSPETREGLLVANVGVVDRSHLVSAVREMVPVYRAGLGMGQYGALAKPGEKLGAVLVPPGKVGVATVSSVTINGVLLGSRVPTWSIFGGVLEISDRKPVRFTDVIHYNGTSLDPLQVFIRGKLTSVRRAARTGTGRIGASFREFPTTAYHEVERLTSVLAGVGLDGCYQIGKPNQSFLEFPVHEGMTGLLVKGGMNPLAAVEEAGIPVMIHPLCAMVPFEALVHFEEMAYQASREEF